MTFELICEGCLEGSLHAVGEKTSSGGASNWQISSGGTEIPSSDIPLAIFPDTLHQALIDAINSGSIVQFKIDRASGLPVEWTIDGVGMRYTCYNADTLPPGLADGRGCVAEFNTIGSTS